MTENRISQQLREEMESIDWDAISDQSRIEAMGSELYELARVTEELGYESTVATGAGLMDGLFAHRLGIGDDAKRVAAGFANAMVRAAANEQRHRDDDEEDTE